MTTLPIFITGNASKAAYLSQLLDIPLEHRTLELDELQSTNLEYIAEHKVRQAYDMIHLPVLVDDVALGFNALQGMPGPFVKFFQEEAGLEAMCRMLDGFDDRGAIATCTMGYYDGSEVRIFQKSMAGTIADHPHGEGGFGWDKIFCPEGYDNKTRAELNQEDDRITYQTIKPIEEVRKFLKELGSE